MNAATKSTLFAGALALAASIPFHTALAQQNDASSEATPPPLLRPAGEGTPAVQVPVPTPPIPADLPQPDPTPSPDPSAPAAGTLVIGGGSAPQGQIYPAQTFRNASGARSTRE